MTDRIEPIHADKTKGVPEGAVVIGVHPQTNEPIYRWTRKRAKIGPKIDPNTGEQEVRRHQVTGVPLNRVNRVEAIYDEELIFTLESDGHANLYMQPCEHPDLLWARERARQEETKLRARAETLMEELARSGLTAAQILEAARGEKVRAPKRRGRRASGRKRREPQPTEASSAGDTEEAPSF